MFNPSSLTLRTALALLCAGAAALAAPPAGAGDAAVDAQIEQLLGHSQAFAVAIRGLQHAVARGDAAAVAAMVSYPTVVTIDGQRRTIATAAEFTRRYDGIVTPAIRQAITEQAYANLFVNGEGVMFGNGEAWLGAVCAQRDCRRVDVKVLRIQPAPR